MGSQIYVRWPIAAKPNQLIKRIWGLGARAESFLDMTIICDDSTLMSMDAPEYIPAGSTRRDETPCDKKTYFEPRDTLIARERMQ